MIAANDSVLADFELPHAIPPIRGGASPPGEPQGEGGARRPAEPRRLAEDGSPHLAVRPTLRRAR